MLKGMIFALTALTITRDLALPAGAGGPTLDELAKLSENRTLRQQDLPFLEAPKPDESLYVTMPDGVRLALSLYFPNDLDRASGKAPAVYEDSVYGRAEDASTTAIDLYRAAGYVVVLGDARGFAASFGSQPGFNTPQQTKDEAEVIRWIADQSWSNGQVAAIGHSVSAVFADSMTSSGAASLKAAIVRASDFDEYAHNMFPGGAPNLGILSLAEELMQWHGGGACSTNLATCGELGFAPVAGDETFELLQAAIRDHKGNVGGEAFRNIIYRDDAIGAMSIGDSGAFSRVEGIRKAAVPTRVAASWLDGVTALSALTRFEMASDVPMEVVIGATTHGGGLDADPFSAVPFGPTTPSAVEQFQADVDFVDRALGGQKIGRSISYVVLGTQTWKTTDIWPPAGTNNEEFNLAAGRLTTDMVASSQQTYTVDPTTTSGRFNRWAAQRGKPIYYGDRKDLPGLRLPFAGEPMSEDKELVGSPELCLTMTTDQSDGLLIAYLEDVAPDGRVTYLTEGILRLLHRNTQGATCDPRPGTQRSFQKADGAAVVPGQPMKIELSLMPVAALIKQGHHLQLSFAGADAGWFEGLTGDTPATWSVALGGEEGSVFRVPLRPWRAN